MAGKAYMACFLLLSSADRLDSRTWFPPLESTGGHKKEKAVFQGRFRAKELEFIAAQLVRFAAVMDQEQTYKEWAPLYRR